MSLLFVKILLVSVIASVTRGQPLDGNITIDIGSCTALANDVQSCLRSVAKHWHFDGDFNTIFAEPHQYCCAIWDLMYCSIVRAREVCTAEELDYIIESTVANQTALQSGHCHYYTRDALFQCRVVWYDLMILVILFMAFLVAVSMVIANNCRQYNQKPEKFQIVQVYV